MLQNMQKVPFQILIAEGNPADVMLVREALKEHRIDCTIQALRDGEQALTFLEQAASELGDRRIDLLVPDLHLPRNDGQEVLKKLRSTRRYAKTPVIVMTATDAKPSTLDGFLNLWAIVRGLLEDKSVETQAMKSGRDSEGVA
jgi:CheY-like chemotaxis protein